MNFKCMKRTAIIATAGKILLAVFLMCAVLCAAVSCKESGKDPETGTDATSQGNSETGTESGNGGDTESESGTSRDPLEEERKAERIREIYEATEGSQRVIAWGIPQDEEMLEQCIRLMLDAGITGVLTCDEVFTQMGLYPVLETATQLGMGVYINLQGTVPYNLSNILRISPELKDCIQGLSLKDEPIPSEYATLKLVAEELKTLFPEHTWPVGANMYPSSSLDYIERFLDQTGSGYASFDMYPYRTHRDIGGYLGNLLLVKNAADARGMELWTYLQTASISGSGDPSYEEMLFEAHLSLAVGADVLELFVVGETPNGEEINYWISHDNQTTSLYENGKAVFTQIQRMKGIYQSYETEGLILLDCRRLAEGMQRYGVSSYLLEGQSYRELVSVQSDGGALISCMQDPQAGSGFYVVNFEYEPDERPCIVTLTFDGEVPYQIWGGEGLEDIGHTAELTVVLEPGEGVFVRIAE